MDYEKIKEGFEKLLEGLGIDQTSTHFRNTAERAAKTWHQELCIGLEQEKFLFTTFENIDHDDSIVMLQSIPVHSLCAHHLLPFTGEATIAYIPSKKLCGLSKLSRTVNYYSRKPQVQEKLTQEILNRLEAELEPQGIGVLIRATHMCMSLRGVNHNGTMTTYRLCGVFNQERFREEFLRCA